MSDTPETEEIKFIMEQWGFGGDTLAKQVIAMADAFDDEREKSRALERQLAELLAENERLAAANSSFEKEVPALRHELAEVRAEKDALERELSSIREIVWSALEKVGDYDQNSPNELLCQFLAGELGQARSVADGLAGALGFYASPANHRPQWTEAIVNPSAIDSDQGKRAQAALAAYAALTGGKEGR